MMLGTNIIYFTGSDELFSGGIYHSVQIANTLTEMGADVKSYGLLENVIAYPNFTKIEKGNYLQGDFDYIFAFQLQEFEYAYIRHRQKKEPVIVFMTEYPDMVEGMKAFRGFARWPKWETHGMPLLKEAEKIIVNSEVVRSYFPEELKEKVEILPPFIGPVIGGASNVEKEGFFITIGRCVEHKHKEKAVDLAKRFNRKLVWVGDGFDFEVDDLLDYAEQRGVDIRFYHKADEKIKWSLLNDAELLIDYSEHEGFGMTPGEACLTTTPAFCKENETLREVYKDHLFYFDDFEDSVEKVKKYLSRTWGYVKKVIKARKFVKRNYSKEMFKKRLKTILRE